MSTWHPSYQTHVLAADYRFASQHLHAHFLNAMLAHVRTVERLALPEAAYEHIRILEGAILELKRQPAPEPGDAPDLYFAFNKVLEREVGETPVSYLRLGLSRNDLDMTVYRMRARELLLALGERLSEVQGALIAQAAQHTETVLVAFTHHQPGQPTTMAHYLVAVLHAAQRDAARLLAAFDRLNECPLGAAALAGTSYGLDRHYTAHALGFRDPVANTYDAVASSDWQVDIVGVAQSLALLHSRFICDLLGWAAKGYFELPDSLVQGSSIMPQKRNPVALEHARTRLSRALGACQMILYSSHNIPFGDLNDFGPDIQGALQTLSLQLDGALALTVACVAGGTFDTERLAEAAQYTDTTATELADELVRRHGLSFQRAHRLVHTLTERLTHEQRTFQSLTPADVARAGGPDLTSDDLAAALSPAAFIRRRNGVGGPAPEVVRVQLGHAREVHASFQTSLGERRALIGRADQQPVSPPTTLSTDDPSADTRYTTPKEETL